MKSFLTDLNFRFLSAESMLSFVSIHFPSFDQKIFVVLQFYLLLFCLNSDGGVNGLRIDGLFSFLFSLFDFFRFCRSRRFG